MNGLLETMVAVECAVTAIMWVLWLAEIRRSTRLEAELRRSHRRFDDVCAINRRLIADLNINKPAQNDADWWKE